MANQLNSTTIQTNGASLEDCHTNFFALADLKGMRWRRLAVSTSDSGGGHHIPNYHSNQNKSKSNAYKPDSNDLLEDPILVSYSKCLALDMLCVWRRVPSPSGHNVTSTHQPGQAQGRPPDPLAAAAALKFTRELWIFWYGEDPDLSDVLSPELSDTEPSGSSETGLPYECRTLLFKAIHNLIERCLLSKGFARLGKWFISPFHIPDASVKPPHKSDSSIPSLTASNTSTTNQKDHSTDASAEQLAFSFNFFVHGDSTVCTSVDIRHMPSVYRLNCDLLNRAALDAPLSVILAPYGLDGLVFGQSSSYKASDPGVRQLLSEWAKFYPISSLVADHDKENSENSQEDDYSCTTLPPIVEVFVAGVKWKYPSTLVYLTDPTANRRKSMNKTAARSHLSAEKNPSASDSLDEINLDVSEKYLSSRPDSSLISASLHKASFPIIRDLTKNNVLQDLYVNHQLKLSNSNSGPAPTSSGRNSSAGEQPSTPAPPGQSSDERQFTWDYADPFCKAGCYCVRCRMTKRQQNLSRDSLKASSTPTKSSNSLLSSKVPSSISLNDKSSSKFKTFHKRRKLPSLHLVQINTEKSSDSARDATCPTRSFTSNGNISSVGMPMLPSNTHSTSPACGILSHGATLDSPRSVAPILSVGTPSTPFAPGTHTTGDGSVGTGGPTSQESNIGLSLGRSGTPIFKVSDSASSPYPNVASVKSSNTLCEGAQILESNSSNHLTTALTSLKRPLLPSSITSSVAPTWGQNNTEYLYNFDSASLLQNAYLSSENDDSDRRKRRRGAASGLTRTATTYSSKPLWDSIDSVMHLVQSTFATVNSGNASRPNPATHSVLQQNTVNSPAPAASSHTYHVLVDSVGNILNQSPYPISNGQMNCNNPNNSSSSTSISAQRKFDIMTQNNSSQQSNMKLHSAALDPYEFSEFDDDMTAVDTDMCDSVYGNGTRENDITSPTNHAGHSGRGRAGSPSEQEIKEPKGELDQIFDTSDDSGDGHAAHSINSNPATPVKGEKRSISMNNINGMSHSQYALLDAMMSTPVPTPNGNSYNGGDLTQISHQSTTSKTSTFDVSTLAHMYPTPPSLEQLLTPSPAAGAAHDIYDRFDEHGGRDSYPCSPLGLNGIDTSQLLAASQSIYKPPVILSTFIINGESKYSHFPHLTPHDPLPKECIYQSKSSNLLSSINNIKNRPQNLSGLKSTEISVLPKSGRDMLRETLIGSSAYDRKGASVVVPGNRGPDGFATPNTPSSLFPPPSPGQRNIRPYQFQPPGTPLIPAQSPYSTNQQSSIAVSQSPAQPPASLPFVDFFGLHVNLLLSDSLLNLYKDHNFESCTLCVCNMNTKGSDMGVYLNDAQAVVPLSVSHSNSEDEQQYKCTCGFSAVVNRHRSYLSGLFWEDETEITGIFYDPLTGLRKNSLTSVDSSPAFLESSRKIESETENTDSKRSARDSSQDNKSVDQPDSASVELMQIAASATFSTHSINLHGSQFELASTLLESLSQTNSNISGDEIRDLKRKCNPLLLEYLDATEITAVAILVTRATMMAKWKLSKSSSLVVLEEINKNYRQPLVLHEWSYRTSTHPSNNVDYVRFLRSIQPTLQSSVQKRRTKELYPVTYTVTGPLTWRQFHKLSENGPEDGLMSTGYGLQAAPQWEDQCEPQPIPSLLVGHEKDWLSISPHALRYWDKLALEPYTIKKDVTYIVVAPDNNCILSNVKHFFKELSATYEMMRLGKHTPIAQPFRDGILTIRKTIATKVKNERVDEWFDQIGDGEICQKLKQYAQACRAYLSLILERHFKEKSIFDANTRTEGRIGGITQSSLAASNQTSNPCSHPNSTTASNLNVKNDGSQPLSAGQDQKIKSEQEDSGDTNGVSDSNPQEAPSQESESSPNRQSNVVLYLVEPFSINADGKERSDVCRLASLGLLRCFTYMVASLPQHVQSAIHLQIISLDVILNASSTESGMERHDYLKSLSSAVFTQCRQSLPKPTPAKTLTGFGPAASLSIFLKNGLTIGGNGSSNVDDASEVSLRRIYAPILMLAPLKDKQTELGEMFGDRREKSSVLFCAYCLTDDQRFIVASVTNDRGDILETTTIKIHVPDRCHRRKAQVRHYGLTRLMDFIITVMSESVQPWRLVVGRVGRVGHGEMKDWAQLLSKKSLARFSARLKSMCKQCSFMPSNLEIPTILSACLITLEAETSLRVFPDQFTAHDDVRCNSASQLATPQDASCTHILTFPTSATLAPGSGPALHDGLGLGNSPGDADLLDPSFSIDDKMLEDDLDFLPWDAMGGDGMVTAMSPTPPPQQPGGGHGAMSSGIGGCGSLGGMGMMSGGDSPDGGRMGFGGNNQQRGTDGFMSGGPEEPLQLLQQPLALGYYVSTARTGPLPSWFWSACPHMKETCPVFLKSALLIHVPCEQQNNDDFHLNASARSAHPLDSNRTTDVLRFVLEGYNSLSWLSLDSSQHDRASCLPMHIQVLMQVYRTVSALL